MLVLPIIAPSAAATATPEDCLVDLSVDGFADGSWRRTDASVAQDASRVVIGEDDSYDDAFAIPCVTGRLFAVDVTARIVSGGQNYVYPWTYAHLSNGDTVIATSLPDGSFGWGLTVCRGTGWSGGLPTGFDEARCTADVWMGGGPASVAEGEAMTLRLRAVEGAVRLEVQTAPDAPFAFVREVAYDARALTLAAIGVLQPWDSVVEVTAIEPSSALASPVRGLDAVPALLPGRIVLAWDAPRFGGAALEYVVARTDALGATEERGVTNDTTFVDDGPFERATYRYTVTARSAAGSGAPAWVEALAPLDGITLAADGGSHALALGPTRTPDVAPVVVRTDETGVGSACLDGDVCTTPLVVSAQEVRTPGAPGLEAPGVDAAAGHDAATAGAHGDATLVAIGPFAHEVDASPLATDTLVLCPDGCPYPEPVGSAGATTRAWAVVGVGGTTLLAVDRTVALGAP